MDLRCTNCLTTLQFFTALIVGSQGCQVPHKSWNPSDPLEQMQFGTRKAIEQMKNGIITLPNFDAKLSTQYTITTPAGGTAEFLCGVDRSGSQTGREQNTVVWRHQERVIHSNSTVPVTNAPFFYSQATTSHASYLYIHNVTAGAAGSVQCLVHNGSTADPLHAIRQFELIPKLRVEDVFTTAMKNVFTVQVQFAFSCMTRVNCSDGGSHYNYLVWRLDKQFIHAPTGHYLNNLYSRDRIPTGILQLHFQYNPTVALQETNSLCGSILTITALNWVSPRLFNVECWARTHRDSDEWYVQAATASYNSVSAFRK